MGQARQLVTVTVAVNNLSGCAKKFHEENFVSTLKGEPPAPSLECGLPRGLL